MPQLIQEFVDSRGVALRVEPEAGLLRGVKLLGLASRNGRTYRETALRKAIGLYEGAKVNVDHPAGGPLQPRAYRDRLGVVKNVELRPGEGLFGTLVYNPKHPLAEQLAWDAAHAPQNVGLSHNVLARTSTEGDRVVVEAIERVQSVDLVADPATTRGLFESEGAPGMDWDALTTEHLALHRPDLLQEMRAAWWSDGEATAAPTSREQRPLGEAYEPAPASAQEFVAAIIRR
ncbi:hypothetical protein Pla175_02990 [Pirellulimonas nuda]|uniref:Caudovirus prohead protease n=1 Tax=Pirellulimonas nuda TaxID=2528009 RepID=A0A518D645_9BACT|nr:hypothetical protein [Pirellulimonas nuda]QDU86945.1 hypothetical protein Pla175_02990 [Pirellulimonas nuda]